MMKETKSKLFSFLFGAVVLIPSGLLLCVHIYMYLDFLFTELYMRDYLYAAVYDPLLLIGTIFFSVVTPLALFLGCIFSLKVKKLGVKICLSILCVIVLLIRILPAFFLNALGCGIASYTDNLDNYTVFDKSVCNTIEQCQIQDFLPEKDLLQENSQYEYYYTFGAINESYHIQLDAQFLTQNAYESEEEKLLNMGMAEYSDGIYYLSYSSNGEKAEKTVDLYSLRKDISVVAHFDEHDQHITYYLFTDYVDTLVNVLEWIQENDSSVPIPVLP